MMCWVTGYTQVSKSDLGRPVTPLLSSAKNKASAVKDSVKSSTNNLLHHSPVAPQTGKVSHVVDTPAPKKAQVKESTSEPDPDEPTTFFIERRDCKAIIRTPIYAYIYVPVERE